MQMAWMVFPRPMSSASSRRPLCAIAKLKWTRSGYSTAHLPGWWLNCHRISREATLLLGGGYLFMRDLSPKKDDRGHSGQGGNNLEKTTNRDNVLCLVAQSCLTLCDPMDCSPPGSCPWGFSRQEYWSGLPCPPPGDLPNPGIEFRSSTLEADSLPFEPKGKPMNTGVGSLSLLQWIFLTQELNNSPLHCRWILHQLSYQGNV